MPINKNAIRRYYIIDQVIRENGQASKKQLISAVAKDLGTSYSEKQFYKDIQDLIGGLGSKKNLGWNCPIVQNKAGGKYEYSDPEFSLTRITFTTKDRTAIETAKKLLKNLKGFPLFQDLEKILNRLSDNINAGLPSPTYVRIDPFISMESKEYKGIEYINILAEKAALKYRVEIHYKDYFSEKSRKFIIEPYLLKEYQNRWYCIAKIKEGSIKSFSLDRIIGIKDLGKDDFYLDDNFSAEDFFAYAYGISTPSSFKPQFKDNWEPQVISLKFDAVQKQYIKDLPLHKSQQIIKETKNYLIVTLKVYITIELIKDLRSFGPRVEVLSPKNLLEEYWDFEKNYTLPNV